MKHTCTQPGKPLTPHPWIPLPRIPSGCWEPRESIFGSRAVPAPGGCNTPRHQEEEEGLRHGPRLSNSLGLDPDHILTGAGASQPENSPYTATASGTRALPGNNAPALQYEGSWQESRRPCQASRGFRLHASRGWARGCKAKPAGPSGLTVFFAKKLPRSWRAGSVLRAEPEGHRGRVGLPWKEAAAWVVSREAPAQVVACVLF